MEVRSKHLSGAPHDPVSERIERTANMKARDETRLVRCAGAVCLVSRWDGSGSWV